MNLQFTVFLTMMDGRSLTNGTKKSILKYQGRVGHSLYVGFAGVYHGQ